MNIKRRIRSTAVFYLLIVLVLALSISAGADVYQSLLGSELTGGLGTFSLDAIVYRNFVGSNYEYTYTYALKFVSQSTPYHSAEGFRIGNPGRLPIFDMANSGNFTNYATGVYDPISWFGAFMNQGNTVTFSYKSLYRPLDTPVNCFVSNAGLTATGETIGLSAMVPESSAIMSGALGLLTLFPLLRRRYSGT